MRSILVKLFYVFLSLSLMIILAGTKPAYAGGITVNSTADTLASDGFCTLREAITNANNDSTSGSTDCAAGSGTDIIIFAGNNTITLTSQLPAVTTPILITGNGIANTIIMAHACDPLGGFCPHQYRVFEVGAAGSLTLDNLTVKHGNCFDPCHITVNNAGGNILNSGTLTITNSLLTNSTAQSGGSIYNNGGMMTITNSQIASGKAYSGGGIYNAAGSVSLVKTTVLNNEAVNFDGGGIYNIATLFINNSTISGNAGGNSVGAIINKAGANLTVIHSTISGNGSTSNGGVYNESNGVLHLTNSILANNSGSDCYNAFANANTIATNINNLIETNGATGNMCGTPMLSSDPNLGPLANNGGATQTFALLPGSPAIDAGDDTLVYNTSQNGVARPQDGDGNNTAISDLGSYEVPDATIPAVTTSIRASANPTNLASVDFTVSFSEPVTGVDLSDFILTTTGVSSPALSGFSGTGSSYTITVNTGSGNGTIRLDVLNDSTIKDVSLNSLSDGFTGGETYTISKAATFSDVPLTYWASSYIERLYNAGITGGCSTVPLNYCPDATVTRAQMAIFLLKGIHGSSYTPPAVGVSTGFGDVATDYWAAAWIKQLAAEGVTSGCGNGNYCPDSVVTRAQMAIFLLKAKNGSSYTPPAVGVSTGFNDVATDAFGAAFIKQLVSDGITAGCSNSNYCPNDSVTRAQMAVFLVRAFNLP